MKQYDVGKVVTIYEIKEAKTIIKFLRFSFEYGPID